MTSSLRVSFHRYMEDYIANAIPTAEGAIQIALEEMPITLHGARCLVVGNGRIGKILSRMLSCMGADVTVSARKDEDFALIYAAGMTHIDTRHMEGQLGQFDLIVNTVPVKILGRTLLAEMKEDCLLIDLASKPGGVDFDGAQDMGKKVIWALSLPGKVAPYTSALAIRDTIYNILKEEGRL